MKSFLIGMRDTTISLVILLLIAHVTTISIAFYLLIAMAAVGLGLYVYEWTTGKTL